MVSIYVPVYNHENYIVRALDSILMQETNFPFEVLVGEDCSTDNTRQVLLDWELEHADYRFAFFYRKENMHGQPLNNAGDLKCRCKGKYIIALEGDDFWTDPKKLQKQVDFLETHPEYYAVAHNCIVVGQDDLPNGECYPECKQEEYTFAHYAEGILPGQLTTILSRNYMTDPLAEQKLLTCRIGPGDRNNVFAMLLRGRIHCMQESMSAYRHITTGGSSFSAGYRYNYQTDLAADKNRLECAYEAKNKAAMDCAEIKYLRCIRGGITQKQQTLRGALQDLKPLKRKLRTACRLFWRDLHKLIKH